MSEAVPADILCCVPPTNRFRFLSAGSWYSPRFSVFGTFCHITVSQAVTLSRNYYRFLSVSGGVSEAVDADILCCVASLVVALGAVERTVFRSRDDLVRMLIVAYGPYVQNALAKSSAWLVVVTAVGRYVTSPVCLPRTNHQVGDEQQVLPVCLIMTHWCGQACHDCMTLLRNSKFGATEAH